MTLCLVCLGSVEYFADAGSCILQGLQELRLTVALNLFGGVYTFIAEWFVLVNRRWPVPFDATLHFSREAILAAFVAVWLHRWLRTLHRSPYRVV